jgi:excisionase family DNA binding protein
VKPGKPTPPPSPESQAGTPGTIDLTVGELLDAEQAAAILGVKVTTLREWVRQGRIPCIRLGPRATRWTRSILADFCAENFDPGRRF